MGISNKAPPAPDDWLPAGRLKESGFDRSTFALKRKLVKLRDDLVAAVASAGFAETDAKIMVDHNLIGDRKPRIGRGGLYASPEAVALLRDGDTDGHLPRAPDHWVSAHKLEKSHLIGDCSKRNQHLVRFRNKLIQGMASAGHSESDAILIVDHNLIGMKRPIQGRAALHASPDAVAMMEREKVIRRRSESGSPDRDGQIKGRT